MNFLPFKPHPVFGIDRAFPRLRAAAMTVGAAAWIGLGAGSAAESDRPAATEAEGTNAIVQGATTGTNPPVSVSTPGTTNAPAGGLGTDYNSFKLIADRNVFNAGRSPRIARNGAERPVRRVQVETFSLVGSMSSGKGDVAFFDGSGSQYRKALKAGESIAGYKISGIESDSVQLEADGKKLKLKLGGQMRREDQGPWELAGGAGTESARTAGSSDAAEATPESSGSAASGDMSDALKRLLQKREQELKNENP